MPTNLSRRPLHLPVLAETPLPTLSPGLLIPAAALPPEGDPFNPHKVLNHFDRLLAIAGGQVVSPVTVEIDPTNVCNHRCQWCVSLEAHTGEVLELDVFARLLVELKSIGVKSIVLKGGGEPTAHPHIIEILDHARTAGLEVGMITNGSMPRRGTRERIVGACKWVRVSLDAATPVTHRAIHGTSDFTRILQNVEYLTGNATDTMVGLNFVAERRNYHEMVDFAEMGKALGCAYVTIRCVFDPTAPLPEDVRAAMRQQATLAKRREDPSGKFRIFLGNFSERYLTADNSDPFPFHRCLGPNLVGIVGGDGNVFACCFLRGNRAFSFGNVNEQSFHDIWHSRRRQDVMEAVYRGECGRVCAGGMTANRYNTYNEILNYLAVEDKQHANFA